MLNCTDLECILHHHHYYQHLHQLQPHLGDRGRDGEIIIIIFFFNLKFSDLTRVNVKARGYVNSGCYIR